MEICIWIMIMAIGVTWLVSVVTTNYSQVDRAWSILPFVYAWVFAFFRPTPRLLLMAVLTTLWGVRLTFNFWRRGGYEWGGEDYRWAEVQKGMSKLAFALLNFVFIAGIQNVLLLLLLLPAQVVFASELTPLGAGDALVTVLFLALLAVETAADQQQYDFQTKKYAMRAAGRSLHGDFQKGFRTSGLFRYSRHPNFACEISIWWTFYLFTVTATGAPLHWALAGPLGLSILFHFSTDFTESITLKKYPAYRNYMNQTPRLFPFLP